jgi:hypothetical protein
LIDARVLAFDWDPNEWFDLWPRRTKSRQFIIDYNIHPQFFEILGNLLGKMLDGGLLK